MDDFNKIILVCPRAKAEEVVSVFTESTRHAELNAFKTLSEESPRDQVRLDQEETAEQDAQHIKQSVRQRGDLSKDEFYILSAEPTGDDDADEARCIRACDLLETHFRNGSTGFFGTPEAHLASGGLVNKYFYVAPEPGTPFSTEFDDDAADNADAPVDSDEEIAGDDDADDKDA